MKQKKKNNNEQAQSLQVQRLPVPLVRRPQKTTRPECRGSAIAGASTMTPQVKNDNNNGKNNNEQAQCLQIQRLPGPLVRRPQKKCPECRCSAIAAASTMNTPDMVEIKRRTRKRVTLKPLYFKTRSEYLFEFANREFLHFLTFSNKLSKCMNIFETLVHQEKKATSCTRTNHGVTNTYSLAV